MSGVAAIVGGPIITHDNSPNSPNDDREANGLDQTANDVQGTCWTRFTHSFKSTIFSTNTVISYFGLEVNGDNHSHRRQSRRLKKKRKGEVGPNGRSIPLITTASMNNGYNNGIHNSGEETHAPPQSGQAANATLNLGQDAETPQRTTSNRLRKSRRRKQTSMIRGAINNGGLTNEGGSTAAGEVSQPGRQTPILLPLSSPTGSRNLTPTTTPILEQLVLWSSQLRKPVEPFPIHLPDDVLRTIFEFAAADLDTACALCLVACHVKVWVDRILYRRVRLEGVVAIGLFARTVREAFMAETGVDSTRDESDETLEARGQNVTNITAPTSQPRVASRQIRKRASFFTSVYSLSIIPQEERVLLFFRDILRDTILILFACANVVELETSGDFLRRTGVGASVELTQSTPSSVLPATAPGTPANTIPSAVFTASTSIPTPNIAGAGLISLGGGPNAFPHTGSLINAAISAGIGIGDTISAVGGNDNRGVNVAGSSTGRGTSLQLLTHVAFDYPLGVTGVKAETLLVLVRSALDVGKPLGWENEGQLLDESDSEDGNNGPEGDTDPFLESNENRQEGSGDQTPPLESETPRRRLKMVIVRILLRPRMKPDKDRTSEVWRQLSDLAARDERLVFFESPGLFGEDIWEKANAIVAARDEGRLSTSWYRESP
ncbi:hypothetical protein FS842_002291 [Serendipita sp. 407]|nr:hypothetical protein FS842_002291 [Serendipita sp. 407]